MQQNLTWCQKDQGVRSIAQKGGNNGFALTTPRVMFDSTRYIYSISILIVPGHSLYYILCWIGLMCCLWHWKSCFPQYASWLSAWLLFLTLSWLVSSSIGVYPTPTPPQMLAKINFFSFCSSSFPLICALWDQIVLFFFWPIGVQVSWGIDDLDLLLLHWGQILYCSSGWFCICDSFTIASLKLRTQAWATMPGFLHDSVYIDNLQMVILDL